MPRPLDHLVIASRDLDTAAAAYRRLGFLVGGRNRHPWGTENHVVQLDGAYLELIGLGAGFARLPEADPAAPFANTVGAYLDRHEGLAMVALTSLDAAGDAEAFAGDGPARTLSFSRSVDGPGGTGREVSFTLAFPAGLERQGTGIFGCQHHRPENFWTPEAQRHPNTALKLLGVVLAAASPADEAARLAMLCGPDSLHHEPGGLRARLGAGQALDVLTSARLRAAYGEAADLGTDGEGGAAVFRIGVGSLSAVQRFINVMGSPYALVDDRLVVPPRVGGGVALSFEEIGDSHAAQS